MAYAKLNYKADKINQLLDNIDSLTIEGQENDETKLKSITYNNKTYISDDVLTQVETIPDANVDTFNEGKLYHNDTDIGFINNKSVVNTIRYDNDNITLPMYIDGLSVAKVGSYVYIFGGRGTDSISDNVSYYYNQKVFRFNLNSKTVSTLGVTSPFTSENGEAIAVGNDIYIFAANQGVSDSSSEIYKFDTTNHTFTKVYTYTGDISFYNISLAYHEVDNQQVIFIARNNQIDTYNITDNQYVSEAISISHSQGYRYDYERGSCQTFGEYAFFFGNANGDSDSIMCFLKLNMNTGEYSQYLMSDFNDNLITSKCYYTTVKYDKYVFFIGNAFGQNIFRFDTETFKMTVLENVTIPYELEDTRAIINDKTIFTFGGTAVHYKEGHAYNKILELSVITDEDASYSYNKIATQQYVDNAITSIPNTAKVQGNKLIISSKTSSEESGVIIYTPIREE